MIKEVLIPEVNVEAFEYEIEKLNRIATKLDCEKVEAKFISKSYKKASKGKSYTCYFKYEIQGETPTLTGYSLVAILERQNTLNLITHIDKTIDLPEGLEEQKNYCEHCNSNRNRKHLFILQNADTKEFIQVGKTCVKDFTGFHKNPEHIARWFEIIDTIDNEITNEDFASYPTIYLSSIDVIAYSVHFIDKEGYIKVHNGSIDNPSTAEKVRDAINSNDITINNSHLDKANEVKDWILNYDGFINDYMTNLKTLLREEIVESGRVGYLASAYNSYLNQTQKKEKTQITKKVSNYVGNIAERKDFNLTFNRVFQFESQFGTVYIYNFLDDDGNVLIWKTSKDLSLTAGEKLTLKGTIKDHQEYRGIKQTVLTRCKI